MAFNKTPLTAFDSFLNQTTRHGDAPITVIIGSNTSVSSVTVSAPILEGSGNLVFSVLLSTTTTTPDAFAISFVGSGVNPTIPSMFGVPTVSNGVLLTGNYLTVPVGVLSFSLTYATSNIGYFGGDRTVTLTVGGVSATGTVTSIPETWTTITESVGITIPSDFLGIQHHGMYSAQQAIIDASNARAYRTHNQGGYGVSAYWSDIEPGFEGNIVSTNINNLLDAHAAQGRSIMYSMYSPPYWAVKGPEGSIIWQAAHAYPLANTTYTQNDDLYDTIAGCTWKFSVVRAGTSGATKPNFQSLNTWPNAVNAVWQANNGGEYLVTEPTHLQVNGFPVFFTGISKSFTTSSTASSGATTLSVSPMTAYLDAGLVLNTYVNGVVVFFTIAADAAVGATSISINALSNAIPSGTTINWNMFAKEKVVTYVSASQFTVPSTIDYGPLNIGCYLCILDGDPVTGVIWRQSEMPHDPNYHRGGNNPWHTDKATNHIHWMITNFNTYHATRNPTSIKKIKYIEVGNEPNWDLNNTMFFNGSAGQMIDMVWAAKQAVATSDDPTVKVIPCGFTYNAGVWASPVIFRAYCNAIGPVSGKKGWETLTDGMSYHVYSMPWVNNEFNSPGIGNTADYWGVVPLRNIITTASGGVLNGYAVPFYNSESGMNQGNNGVPQYRIDIFNAYRALSPADRKLVYFLSRAIQAVTGIKACYDYDLEGSYGVAPPDTNGENAARAEFNALLAGTTIDSAAYSNGKRLKIRIAGVDHIWAQPDSWPYNG